MEELTLTLAWLDDSLRHAQEDGLRKLVWLLEAVQVEVRFEIAPQGRNTSVNQNIRHRNREG